MTQQEITDEQWARYLLRNGAIEGKDEISRRRKIITLLNSILPNFQRKVITSTDYKRGDLDCFLFPFGSYGLGGYLKGADIDLVLVCPRHIKRNDFYKFFPDLLRQQQTVKEIEVIRKTNVPIIKCRIDSISIDISFVRLRGNRLRENIDLLDEELIKDLDSICLASMDGPRVHKFIKNQVKPEHVRIFQTCLQCIKYWASRRDIYSKPCGYLNGSSWTLLLLKIYMQERASANDISVTYILRSFFDTWSDWPWQTPVILTDFIPGKNGQRVLYKDLSEFVHAVMPIVSPCYPVCNVAPYVTKSTLKIMIREFQRALVILETNAAPETIMHKLFQKTNYYKRYKDFLCIVTTSLTAGSHDIWTRRMQYVLTDLLTILENVPDIKLAQAMVKQSVVDNYYYQSNDEKYALQNGSTGEAARFMTVKGDLNPGQIYIIYQFIGVQLNDNCKTLDLSEEIRSFMAIMESKRKRDDADVKWAVVPMKRQEVDALRRSIDPSESG